MSRFFGYIIGAIWLVFTFMAFRMRSAGVEAGQPDVTFWWTVITLAYLGAATVAIVGNVRHRPNGPRKPGRPRG
jgi:hypothetical protein